MSSCPVGKNCIQGTSSSAQDTSINATYSSSGISSNDLLTFSGFGLTDSNFSIYGCMDDSEIPGTNPGTFITEFKIGNAQWIECNRPNAPTGYTVNCPGSDATLYAGQCSVACDTGYISVGDGPQLSCPSAGSDFSFSGCVQAQRISDCSKVTSSGNYVTTLVSASGEVTEDVLVYCTHDAGVGYLDLVKTIGLSGIDLDQYKNYFFSSNDSSSITIEFAENNTNVEGILIKNTGDNGSTIFNGFHIHQDSIVLPMLILEYRMQGGVSTDSCNSGDWVPLSGPGSLGTDSSSQVTCPSGKTCIQGFANNGSDSSINASYNSSAIGVTDLLTFSGAGGSSDGSIIMGACNLDANIPSTVPSTFITKLRVRNVEVKSCTKPNIAGYTWSCADNLSEFTEAQCLLSCATGYESSYGGPKFSCQNDGEDFIVSGCHLPNELTENFDQNIDLSDEYYSTNWDVFIDGGDHGSVSVVDNKLKFIMGTNNWWGGSIIFKKKL